jgi:hypothetical protein
LIRQITFCASAILFVQEAVFGHFLRKANIAHCAFH